MNEAGYVDPTNLLFASARITKVREAVPVTARAVVEIARALRRLIESADSQHAVDLS